MEPNNPQETKGRPVATGPRRPLLTINPWILTGFILTFLLFHIVPVYLNKEKVMNTDPGFSKPLMVDIRQILDFARPWYFEHKTPYVTDNTYPPLETLFVVPLLHMSPAASFALLTLTTVALYIVLTLILPGLFSRERQMTPLILLFGITGLYSYPLAFELNRGQFNVIAMTFCMTGIYLFHHQPRWRWLAYLLFSISIQLKIYPAIFVLMLIDNWRDWLAILKRFTLLGVANFLALFVFGPSIFMDFIRNTAEKMKHPYVYWGNHSIQAYASLIEQYYHAPKGIIAPAVLVIYALLLGTLLLVAWKRNIKGFNPFLLLGCTIGALILPAVSHDYALTYLAAPAAILAGSIQNLRRPDRKLALLALSGAYFCTIFSIALKSAYIDLIFANNLPALMLLLAATVWLCLTDRDLGAA